MRFDLRRIFSSELVQSVLGATKKFEAFKDRNFSNKFNSRILLLVTVTSLPTFYTNFSYAFW